MITSTSNSQVRYAAQLNSRAKFRREEQCFAAEGIRLFQETPQELRRAVYASASFASSHQELLAGVDYETVEDRVFEKMCDTRTPQGILTITSMPVYTLEDLSGRDGQPSLIMVLEDVQDPGNVGTILRTAEGAGVTGVLMSSGTADVFQPKVIRSTMGSIYRVPFVRTGQLSETLQSRKEKGLRVFAAHLQGSRDFRQASYTGDSAFLIGNEGNGLSEGLASLADEKIRIPMCGQVESLNAAIAAGLLMYEAQRQRESIRGSSE